MLDALHELSLACTQGDNSTWCFRGSCSRGARLAHSCKEGAMQVIIDEATEFTKVTEDTCLSDAFIPSTNV